MRVYEADGIRELERLAIESGLSELRLMENAGAACAKVIRSRFDLENKPETAIAVLCGKGKNGGDGFVIARKLKDIGCDPVIVLTDGLPTIEEPIEEYERAKRHDVRSLRYSTDRQRVEEVIKKADLLIDCVFGIGFRGEANEVSKELFEAVNAAKGTVVAIDVPSGLDCKGSNASGVHMIADLTIGISVQKPVYIFEPAASDCGKLVLVSIGLPDECYEQVKSSLELIDAGFAAARLGKRSTIANKGDYGTVLHICGSRRMPGAAVLSASAAVHTGVGKLYTAFPESAYPAMVSHLVEPLFLPMPEDENGFLSIRALERLLPHVEQADCVLIGCGMGLTDETKTIVEEVLKAANGTVIIDADGINAVASNIDILRHTKANWILTPHLGEMARLVGGTAREILENRMETACDFRAQYDGTLVLKGANTLVAQQGRPLHVNITGNPGMAQAGTGDVLAGMIASFAAQGLEPFEAACLAVRLHGEAGDVCAKKQSQRGMTTRSMINALPLILNQYEQKG